MKCVLCEYEVRPDFSHFCHPCYHRMKRKYAITADDFMQYLRNGLNLHGNPPPGWKFKEIHTHLKTVYPTMLKLANLLENALFLKIALLGELHLNTRERLPLNGASSSPDYGFVRARVCRFIC